VLSYKPASELRFCFPVDGTPQIERTALVGLARSDVRIVQVDRPLLEDAIRRVSQEAGLSLTQRQADNSTLTLSFQSRRKVWHSALRPCTVVVWKCADAGGGACQVETSAYLTGAWQLAFYAGGTVLAAATVTSACGMVSLVPLVASFLSNEQAQIAAWFGVFILSLLAFATCEVCLLSVSRRVNAIIESTYKVLRECSPRQETTLRTHVTLAVTNYMFLLCALLAPLIGLILAWPTKHPLIVIAGAATLFVPLLVAYHLWGVPKFGTLALVAPAMLGCVCILVYVLVPLILYVLEPALVEKEWPTVLVTGILCCMLASLVALGVRGVSDLVEVIAWARRMSLARRPEEAWEVLSSRRGTMGMGALLFAGWLFLFSATAFLLLATVPKTVLLLRRPSSSVLSRLLVEAFEKPLLAPALRIAGGVFSCGYAAAPFLLLGYFVYRRAAGWAALLRQCKGGEEVAREWGGRWASILGEVAVAARIDAPRMSMVQSPAIDCRAVRFGFPVSRSYLMITDTGLLRLSPDELRALMAHEVFHLTRHSPRLRMLRFLSNLTLFGRDLLCHLQNPYAMEMEADEFAARCFGTAPLVGALQKARVANAFRSMARSTELGFQLTRDLAQGSDQWWNLSFGARFAMGFKILGDVYFGDQSLWYLHPSTAERMSALERTAANDITQAGRVQ